MPSERHSRLTTPPTFHLPDLSEVAPGVVAGSVDERRIEVTYVDTADLRLARSGVSLEDRHGQGWALELPAAGRSAARHRLDFGGKPGAVPAEAARLVAAFQLDAELRPVARVSTLRRRVVLHDDSGADIVEVLDDEVSVLEGRRVAARFRQLEIAPLTDAADEVVEGVRERLLAAGAGDEEPAPNLMRALGPTVQRSPAVAAAQLGDDATAGDAVAAALAQPANSLLRNDWALRRGEDADAVRRVRVAARRLRSRLRVFAGLVDRDWSRELAAELGWLGDALSAVRDHDVRALRIQAMASLLEPPDRAGVHQLAERSTAAAAEGRRTLVEVLDSDRYRRLLQKVAASATAPMLTGDHARPAAELLPALPRAPWKRLREAVQRLGSEPSEAALHQVRIRAKQARYAAEAVVAVEPAAEELATALEAVQRTLGEHHDSATTRSWLRQLAGTGRRAFIAGQLYAIEGEVADRALNDFRDAWRAAKRPRLRKWME